MVVLTKKIIDSHDVIIDTNILHCEDKSLVVNKEFDEFWGNHSADLDLSLKIPHVVYGELLFQRTTSALKTLSRANDSIERLSKVTSKTYSHQITETRVKKEVKERFDAWIKKLKVEVLESPVESIDWKRIIDDSIWRKPPFSYDPKKDDLEKGFRDAIILETMCRYAELHKENPLILITNDTLLRETAESRLKSKSHVKVMSSIDDLDSYFKLMRENFTSSFVDSVIDKASLKFINHKDKNCIVFKENLRSVLRELAGSIISDPSNIPGVGGEEFDLDEEWTPVSRGQFTRFGKSQFLSLEEGHTFNWKEDVRFTRDFEVESWDASAHQATLTIYFEVYWKANISESGRFTKVTYLDSKLIEPEISYMDC